MAVISLKSIFRAFVPTWLTGPIFGKELRVASRRPKHYMLRVGYLAALGIFAGVSWGMTVGWGGTSSLNIDDMSQAAKSIVMTITWVQFFAIQLIAVATMSSSISDEVYHGTLASLMTTPISNLQIVGGKLLSKMLHLVCLMAVSLPLLTLVRVFGGVPWGYIIAGWCITLTAGTFAGAVAMFFSTMFRRSYAIVLLTLAAGAAFYGVLPMILGMTLGLLGMLVGAEIFGTAVLFSNPVATLFACTMEMADPGSVTSVLGISLWPLHCLIMLGLSAVMILCCVATVRRTALRNAFGGASASGYGPAPIVPGIAPPAAPPQKPADAGQVTVFDSGNGPMPVQMPAVISPQPRPMAASEPKVRRISGSPLVWRKLRTPMLQRKTARVVFLVISLVLLGWSYVVTGASGALDDAETHASYAVFFTLMGIVATTVLAATGISSEKETRTLPILLTTPLSDWHIIWAMVVEVFRRSLGVWLFLLIHMAVGSVLGLLHPLVVLHMIMLVASVVIYISGTGLYFSSRYRKTRTAVSTNMAFTLLVWGIVPVIGGLAYRGLRDWESLIVIANPVVQAGVLVFGAGRVSFLGPLMGRPRGELLYSWPGGLAGDGPGWATLIMFVSLLGYSLLGLFCLWLAKRRLRKDLF